MKTSDIRSKTRDELIEELAALRKEQFNLHMQRNSGDAGAAPVLHRFKQLRREVARIKTILNEKAKIHDSK